MKLRTKILFWLITGVGSIFAEDSAVDRIQKGSRLLEQGNLAASVAIFQSVLSDAASQRAGELTLAVAHYHLGWAYTLLDRDQEAQAEYGKAEAFLNPHPEFHYPHLMRVLESEASLETKRKQYQKARALVERAESIVANLAPENRLELASLSVDLGAIDQLEGKLDRASIHYRQGLAVIEAVAGRSSAAWRRVANNLALLLLQSGQKDEAAYYIDQALRQDDTLIGLDRVVKAKLLLTRFDVNIASGRKQAAQQDATQALEILMEDLGASNRLTAVALLRCQQVSRALGHKAEARAYGRRAKESLDGSPSVQFERSTINVAELRAGRY